MFSCNCVSYHFPSHCLSLSNHHNLIWGALAKQIMPFPSLVLWRSNMLKLHLFFPRTFFKFTCNFKWYQTLETNWPGSFRGVPREFESKKPHPSPQRHTSCEKMWKAQHSVFWCLLFPIIFRWPHSEPQVSAFTKRQWSHVSRHRISVPRRGPWGRSAGLRLVGRRGQRWTLRLGHLPVVFGVRKMVVSTSFNCHPTWSMIVTCDYQTV